MAQAKTASALPHGLGRRCLTTCFSCSRSGNNTSSSSTISAAQPAATGAAASGGSSPHSSGGVAGNKRPSSSGAEMMTGRLRVRLHGGAPWGFRLFGGDDLPLLIAKVSLFYDYPNSLFLFQLFFLIDVY